MAKERRKVVPLPKDWEGINEFLVAPTTTEARCLSLLEREKAGLLRASVLLRVHSTYARKRYLRERAELTRMARAARR